MSQSQSKPSLPSKPDRPGAPTKVRPASPAATIPMMLVFILGAFLVAVLSLLTLGFAGMVLGIGLLMAAFIALQYLIWGWWLGAVIERAEEKKEARQRQSD